MNALEHVRPVMPTNVRIIFLVVQDFPLRTNFDFLSLYLEACLCTAAKRDSLYDDPTVSLTKTYERQSADQYGFVRTGKYQQDIEKILQLSE